ncbi:MAG: hypothetical protein FIA97_02910 [Methylococcaceae bacterium]|nr:hypothetical protein [Methylococcaceae bacterium]
MLPLRISLREFADPASLRLETTAQARRAVAAVNNDPRRWVELDFSGIAGASPEFTEELFRLADAADFDIWLVPVHYDIPATTLVIALKDRLQRQRDREWDRACKRCCSEESGRP